MSKASGFVLILAGLAAAAYVLPSSDTDMGDPEFLHFTDIAKTYPTQTTASAPAPAVSAPSRVAAVPEPTPAVRPATRRTTEPVPSFSTPVVVTIAQRPSEPAPAPPPRATSIPRDRDAIARELQKELRRVGCYEGELNGAWTPLTRQAMKAFTDRVNATLPTDEPDSILLTLVQAYQDKVCGKPCPAGQGLSDGGRCVPNAILARTNTKKAVPVAAAAPADKPTPAITGWSTATTAASPTPPIGTAPTEGRMALAGPPVPDATAPTTPAVGPPRAPDKRAPPPRAERAASQGGWANNLFRHHDSLN